MNQIDPRKIMAGVQRRRAVMALRGRSATMSMTAMPAPLVSLGGQPLPEQLPDTTPTTSPAEVDAQMLQLRERLTVRDMSAERFAQAALLCHEAAHAITAAVYGGVIRTVTADPAKAAKVGREHFGGEHFGDGVHGVTTYKTSPVRPELTTLAGPIAHARFCVGGQRRPTRREVDRVLQDEGQHDAEAITAAGGWIGDIFGEVNAIVERLWTPICELAQRIHDEGEVGHSTVLDVLGAPENDPGVALSLLRNGAAPGTFTVTPAAV
ncbi:hypothetical protein [Mycolicibacter arupensis]|jgi:hypothetical protein|uniref:Peptidase M41 domain-containing protein n=1 Tax=Mycolicibacter arupensis TaxID=342002 RepID=A0A5C7Y5B9_9MYCO|nr:hypothetical protein [Mycolicibacter arupensis]TXI56887.1 MAG: hypothetical protein E6Q54_09315 [Mycolicibacter arupensis]